MPRDGAPGIAYRVELGARTLSSRPQDSEGQLLSLATDLDMDSVGGRCRLTLGGAALAPPAPGDSVRVDLDAGDGAARCFTGQVESAGADPRGVWVEACDGLVRLARLEAEAAYEDVKAGFVVKDLIARAGLAAGTVADGIRLAAYAVHRAPRALEQIRRLGELCGADLYTDGAGKVHFATPKERGTERRYGYGSEVMDLELAAAVPTWDSLEVWGEGAASAEGAQRHYWLSSDLKGVDGRAVLKPDGQVQEGSLGERPRRLVSGAVRSGEAAAAVARAGMESLAARALRGFLDLRGAPGVEPGDRVAFGHLPADHALALLLQGRTPLRVRRVCHRLSRTAGLRTRLGF